MNDPCFKEDSQIDKALGEDWPVKNRKTMLTEDEIKAIAIAVRESVTRRWHHPDWNYMYYDQFEIAVVNGIQLALKKQAAKDAQASGRG